MKHLEVQPQAASKERYDRYLRATGQKRISFRAVADAMYPVICGLASVAVFYMTMQVVMRPPV